MVAVFFSACVITAGHETRLPRTIDVTHARYSTRSGHKTIANVYSQTTSFSRSGWGRLWFSVR